VYMAVGALFPLFFRVFALEMVQQKRRKGDENGTFAPVMVQTRFF